MSDQIKKLLRYEPSKIESKWQKIWEEKGLNTFDKNAKGDKWYTLVELPYPSGDLHIGHWFAFVPPDVLSRFKKMNGKHVFFPMGFDAFGLPAENAAIKRNIHPQDWTMQNIETMTKQFKTMGTMIDWSRVTISCLPEYYKWNQWIFIEMYKKGLAYRSKMLSNWCPFDQTVLANEHVENGKCWRCGTLVVQKEVEQWFLKITDYADRLEWQNDGNGVDWPMSVQSAQNEWIGKKEGMKITHQLVDIDLSFETFTAYPAWSWADTFIVMAPEHPLVSQLVEGTPQENEATAFVAEMAKESELERKETNEKKGVFTGRYAKDPFGGPDMPIWLANFALMNFGTGIIRCSAHDPRDMAFAKKYHILTKEVVDDIDGLPANAHDNKGILKNSGIFTGRAVGEVREEVMKWIEKKEIGKRFINYHLHDWSVSRQRYWGTPVPMIDCPNCGLIPVPGKNLPVTLPYNVDYQPKGKPPLASNEEWLAVDCPECGGKAQRDAETLDTFFDSSWYYYRYLNPENSQEPFSREDVEALMPVNVYFGGGEHTLGHTLYARFFTKFFHDLGLVSFNEFAQQRIQHGIVLGPDGNKMSKSKGNVINPDDVVKEFGTDTVRMYLCFMMPYEATGPWSTTATYGVFRFLKRVWDLAEVVNDSEISTSDLLNMHKTIKKVTQSIENNRLNTAVASMMEWINYLAKKTSVAKEEYQIFLKLLSPFAPFLAEEIWQSFFISATNQHQFASIHNESWPLFEEKYMIAEQTQIIVQINGKMREMVSVDTEIINNQKKVEELALQNEKIKKYIVEGKIVLVKYVIGRVINFVLA